MEAGKPWQIVTPFPLDEGGFFSFFVELLAEHSPERVVREKNQLRCLRNYLEELEPKSAVVEQHYTSRDYLEDYAAYYARCHHPYGRVTTRIHFFSEDLGEKEFDRAVAHRSDETRQRMQSAYLGFVILRPLPHTFIGMSCLQPYKELNGQRCYAARDYEVNLFGIPLTVSSIAFQEQDQAVAVCATTAVWSALQQTSSLWKHSALTPAAVAELAAEVPRRTRALPSDGLTPEQMARVIQRVGLEPQEYKIRTTDILKGVAYAYLNCHIPLLFGYDQKCQPPIGCREGQHAVAITGMRLTTSEKLGKYRSDRVERLFVHDDQAVPYARMNLSPAPSAENTDSLPVGAIGTALGPPRYAVPRFVIIPLYNKIRIPFVTIREAIAQLDEALIKCYPETERFCEWDIRLSSLEQFRETVHLHVQQEHERRRLLTMPLPKYLWQVTARGPESVPLIDFLFDATDIGQQQLFLMSIKYDELRAGMIELLPEVKEFKECIRSPRSLLWQMCSSVSEK